MSNQNLLAVIKQARDKVKAAQFAQGISEPIMETLLQDTQNLLTAALVRAS